MPSHRNVALVRDIVEVVAILVAGIWAIYVFVYTDRIEPYTRPQAPKVDASIAVVGARGNLLALRLQQSIANTGPSPLYVLGSIAAVTGQIIRPSRREDLRVIEQPDYMARQRFGFGRLEEAYSYYYRQATTVMPGARWEHSWIIFILRSRYDVLIFDPTFAFTRDPSARRAPQAEPNSRGVLGFKACGVGEPCPDFADTEIQLSLWPAAH